jgi:hypothetical protein
MPIFVFKFIISYGAAEQRKATYHMFFSENFVSLGQFRYLLKLRGVTGPYTHISQEGVPGENIKLMIHQISTYLSLGQSLSNRHVRKWLIGSWKKL